MEHDLYISIFYQVLFRSHAQSKQNRIEHLLNMFFRTGLRLRTKHRQQQQLQQRVE